MYEEVVNRFESSANFVNKLFMAVWNFKAECQLSNHLSHFPVFEIHIE